MWPDGRPAPGAGAAKGGTMTHKPRKYGARLLQKMKARKVRRKDVQTVLLHGVEYPTETFRGSEMRRLKVGTIRGRVLRVVFIERAAEVLIVSAHWKAKLPVPKRRKHEN